MVGAGFEGDVNGCFFDEMAVCVCDRVDAIDFGVGFPVNFVIAFADDAIVVNQYRTDHGIGRYVTGTELGQLQAAVHVCFRSGQGRKFKYNGAFIVVDLGVILRDGLVDSAKRIDCKPGSVVWGSGGGGDRRLGDGIA